MKRTTAHYRRGLTYGVTATQRSLNRKGHHAAQIAQHTSDHTDAEQWLLSSVALWPAASEKGRFRPLVSEVPLTASTRRYRVIISLGFPLRDLIIEQRMRPQKWRSWATGVSPSVWKTSHTESLTKSILIMSMDRLCGDATLPTPIIETTSY